MPCNVGKMSPPIGTLDTQDDVAARSDLPWKLGQRLAYYAREGILKLVEVLELPAFPLQLGYVQIRGTKETF